MIAREAKDSGWDKLCAVSRALVRYQFSERGPLLRMSAWSELPEDTREGKLKTINQLGQRFVAFLVDGMKDGSIRPLDQPIASFLVSGMINASVILDRWGPDITAENAVELFARPLFWEYWRIEVLNFPVCGFSLRWYSAIRSHQSTSVLL